MNILDTIVEHKKQEVSDRKKLHPLSSLTDVAAYANACIPVSDAFSARPSGVIAEFKRKSPSKQNINISADLSSVILWYDEAGVTAISVLTDEHFFGGSAADLIQAKKLTNKPILRKDFIVDDYQVHESKSMGADIILLIAEILDKSQLHDLAHLAKSLGLNILMEIHSEVQIDKYCDAVDIIGVNNRDLDRFMVDYNNSLRLLDMLPDDCLRISESGILDLATAKKIRRAGYDGLLIGEHFMKASNPLAETKRFVSQLNL